MDDNKISSILEGLPAHTPTTRNGVEYIDHTTPLDRLFPEYLCKMGEQLEQATTNNFLGEEGLNQTSRYAAQYDRTRRTHKAATLSNTDFGDIFPKKTYQKETSDTPPINNKRTFKLERNTLIVSDPGQEITTRSPILITPDMIRRLYLEKVVTPEREAWLKKAWDDAQPIEAQDRDFKTLASKTQNIGIDPASNDKLRVLEYSVSPNQENVLVTIAVNNSQDSFGVIINTETGDIDPNIMPYNDVRNIHWDSDDSFTYTATREVDSTGDLICSIARHHVGSDYKTDDIIVTSGSKKPYIGGIRTPYIFDHDNTSPIEYISYSDGYGGHMVLTRAKGSEDPFEELHYTNSGGILVLGQQSDKLIIGRSNSDHTPDSPDNVPRGQIAEIDIKTGELKPLVNANENNVITNVKLINGAPGTNEKLFAVFTRDYTDLTEGIEIYDLCGNKLLGKFNFPEPCSANGIKLKFNEDGEIERAFLEVSTNRTPPSVYEQDLKTNKLEMFKAGKSSARLNHKNYESKVINIDINGESIPVELLYKKNIDLNNAPLLVKTYGGFNNLTRSDLSAGTNLLVEDGIIYARIHPRGDQTKGEDYYRAAVSEQKTTTFSDVAGAVKSLHKMGFSSPERTILKGTSNGGYVVTMTALLNPDICAVVLADRAVTDMANFPLRSINEFGPSYQYDYGNVMDSAAELSTALKRSPVHTIPDAAKQKLPTWVISAGDSDRIVGLENSIALFRELHRNGHSTFYTQDNDTGHGKDWKAYREEFGLLRTLLPELIGPFASVDIDPSKSTGPTQNNEIIISPPSLQKL